MRQATAALTAYLGANATAVPIDLYTFALQGGSVLRFTSGKFPLTIPAPNFPGSPLNYAASGNQSFAVGPGFGRSKVTHKVGVEPTDLDVSIYPRSTDLVGTLTWQQAFLAGEFDGATIELDRFFMPAGQDGVSGGPGSLSTSLGAIVWFYGRIAEVPAGRSVLQIKVKSLLNLAAQQQMPRRLFQAGCTHVFGDAMCGYDRVNGKAANGTATGIGAQTVSALGGSNASQIVTSFSPSPATAYDQGTITGISGANAGVVRTISQVVGGTVYLRRNFPSAPATGDTFQLLPGCDHTLGTCNGTFLNILRYGGMPYVPPPELAL